MLGVFDRFQEVIVARKSEDDRHVLGPLGPHDAV